MSRWQLIDSAPKDGKPFLAWAAEANTYPGVARWHQGTYRSTLEEIALRERGSWSGLPLTHWMRLPDPPVLAAPRGEDR